MAVVVAQGVALSELSSIGRGGAAQLVSAVAGSGLYPGSGWTDRLRAADGDCGARPERIEQVRAQPLLFLFRAVELGIGSGHDTLPAWTETDSMAATHRLTGVSDPLRILYILDNFSGPHAGTEGQFWLLFRNLDRARFAPAILLLRP